MTVKQIILILIALGISIPFFIPARTEEIVPENGKESIAEIIELEIGGTDQSLIIRGKDLNNPILLFLSGGPGASELARVREFNQELENDYTLVVWEQRGGGKSFDGSLKKEDLEVEDFVNDIKEVSEYLIDRFNKEKIYLMGHSWGTIIGVEAAKKFPELFHAYIGAAQMVSVKEADKIIYNRLLEYAKENDKDLEDKLIEMGEPPYTGEKVHKDYLFMMSKEFVTFEIPNIKNKEYLDAQGLFDFITIKEYSMMDRINFFRGAIKVFNAVYPQLQDFDFRESATNFDIPVYILTGSHDYNAPYWITEEYFNKIKAPSKEHYWFSESGHGQIWSEADKFHEIMRSIKEL